MKLIADSGASKTDWILIEGKGEHRHFQTEGLNPFYIDAAGIGDVIEKELLPFIESQYVHEIFFYGAGCSSVFNKMLVEDAFIDLFKNANINVHSDLLGAARALLGETEGIACILGTGSNSCFYNGKEIVTNIPSLGYLFGDEGSGAHMGKMLCTDFMLDRLPGHLQTDFKEKFNLTRENILHSVYRLPFPNRFLASFSLFLYEHISDPWVIELVSRSFRQFLINNVAKYENYNELPVNFTGSVAFYFRELLTSVSKSVNINIPIIEKSPINGLIHYHLK